MLRVLLLLTAFLAPVASPHAQRGDATTGGEEKGPFLGVLFASVTEALYDQLPQLPRKQGVLVAHVLPDSPAAKADIRKNDILLQFDEQKIRDCEDFATIIRRSKPERKVNIKLLRGGKEISVEAVIALGPALRIADASAPTPGEAPDAPKGVAKPNGPAAVSVAATPLEQGRMRVTIEYLPDGETRLRTVTCEGAAAEIDHEVEKLPEKERGQARTALQRIRNLISDKPDAKRGPG
jgi:membrane-associated protease RseP (regulator of RpoE activity)